MPAIASASVVSLYYVAEVAGAIPASPVWKPIRYKTGGNSLAYNAERITSEEVRGDRHKTADRRGTFSAAGDISAQLAYGALDDLLEAGFCGSWVAATPVTNVGISAANADSSFNSAATFTQVAGDLIKVSGFASPANNGLFRVVTATTSKLTVVSIEGLPVVLVTVTAGPSITVTAQSRLITGITRRTFAILERHTDLGIDYLYRGMEVDKVAISGTAGEKWDVTFSLLGTSQEQLISLPAGSTFTAATTTDFMTALDGSLDIAGAEFGFCTEYTASVANGIAQKYVVGSKNSVATVIDTITADGTVVAFFDSAAFYNRFLNDTKATMSLVATDAVSAYRLKTPDASYVSGSKQSSGTDVIVSLTYSAGYNLAANSEFVMERLS
jgi:hypothetical protein